MEQVLDTLVIGGGQAGLASGYHLKKNRMLFKILEATDQHAGSWPYYYDSLQLFSPARFSSLPGLDIPGKPDHYPDKNEVIDYLQSYAKHFELPIVGKQKVIGLEQKEKHFVVKTSSGDRFYTRTIISATGSFHNPYKPVIKDQERFSGTIIHSSEYKKPDLLANQRVIVVGRGNSAVQIAIELANIAKVTLAVKQPVHLMKQKVFGWDLHYWLRWSGLDVFPFWRIGRTAPSSSSVIDLHDYNKRLTAGVPDQQPMFDAFYPEGVVWQGGNKEPVETVIFATGYRASYDYLKDTGALDSNGEPIQAAGVSHRVPGLYFVGLNGQRSFSSATLRGVGPDAQFVVKRLRRHLQRNRST